MPNRSSRRADVPIRSLMDSLLEYGSPMLKRLTVLLVFAVAFLAMASVFSPERTKAGGVGLNPVDGSEQQRMTTPREPHPTAASIDPHEGLRSLGSLESARYAIHIYATNSGPRYSIYERADQSTAKVAGQGVEGREAGVLLTADQVNQWFPEIQLPAMDFSATDSSVAAEADSATLMLAEPLDAGWPQ
jgi:hypothetical protein